MCLFVRGHMHRWAIAILSVVRIGLFEKRTLEQGPKGVGLADLEGV